MVLVGTEYDTVPEKALPTPLQFPEGVEFAQTCAVLVGELEKAANAEA